MNFFDKSIIDFLLSHVGRSRNFYYFMNFVAENDNLLKGGFFAILIWYFWFKPSQVLAEKRVNIVATLSSIFCVMVVTLALAGLAPFRPRPFLNSEFLFLSSDGSTPYLSKWSSFPSDHAALFTALATGFFFISKRAGIITTLYSIILIFFPRVYLGYHYPTDIIVGALLGASITYFFNRSRFIKKEISRIIIPFSESHQPYFYAILFFITYEIADLFAGSRNLLSFLYNLFKHTR